jgi:hypothetical protein
LLKFEVSHVQPSDIAEAEEDLTTGMIRGMAANQS